MTINVPTHLFKQLPILALLLCLQVLLLSCGGKKKPETPPERPPEKPPASAEKNRYEKGEILLITAEDYGYFAEVTADTKLSATEVPVRFFVQDARKTLGNNISLEAVMRKRENRKTDGGTRKFYFNTLTATNGLFQEMLQCLKTTTYFLNPSKGIVNYR